MTNLFEKKDCVIPPIRVTASEKLEVEMLAAASNKKVSAFILDCIFNKYKQTSLDPIDTKTFAIDYIKKYKDFLKSNSTGSLIDDYNLNHKISVIDEILIDILDIEKKGGFTSIYGPKMKRGL